MVKQIRALEEYKTAQNVLLYYPKENELDFRELAGDGKKFYLPRIEKGVLIVCPWQEGDKLELSSFSVYEPVSAPVNEDVLDLVILPGLCADVRKNRLGYGKGCYDEFLPKCRAISLFPVPDELLFNSIPAEAHDVKPDMVLTPTQILR